MDAYRNFSLWQRACDLAESIYRRTCRLPDMERNGLTSQLRQTALDIPCQIAASPMQPTAEFLLNLTQVQSSLRRLEVQVLLADRLHYLPAVYTSELTQRIADVQRLLDAFFGTLQPNRQARQFGRLA